MRASTLFSTIAGETARKKGGGLLWPIVRKKNSTSLRSAAFVTIFVCTLVHAHKFDVHYFATIFLNYLKIPRLLIIWKKIIAVIHITLQLRKKKAWKNSGLYGIRILDQCDTGAGGALPIELTSQDVELVRIKPVKGWWCSYEYMKIIYLIYENCGVKNYMKEDHCR